jgi:hypothetical protein
MQTQQRGTPGLVVIEIVGSNIPLYADTFTERCF